MSCSYENCPKPRNGNSLIYKDAVLTSPLKMSYQRGAATFELWMTVGDTTQMFGNLTLECVPSNEPCPGDGEPVDIADLVPEAKDLIRRIQAVVTAAIADNNKIQAVYVYTNQYDKIVGIKAKNVSLVVADWRAEHYSTICAWCCKPKTIVKSIEQIIKLVQESEDTLKKKLTEIDAKLERTIDASIIAIEKIKISNELVLIHNTAMATDGARLAILEMQVLQPATSDKEAELAKAEAEMAEIMQINARTAIRHEKLLQLRDEMKLEQAKFSINQ